MLRLLRALTTRSAASYRPDSRRSCARCGRSFAPPDEAAPDVYCWWCVTHHAAARAPLPVGGPE